MANSLQPSPSETEVPRLPALEEPEVAVVFTSVSATIAALKRAVALTKGLYSRISIVIPQVVPYPLPIETPTVPLGFTERLIRQVEVESDVQVTTRLYYCRDRAETLARVLQPHTVIIMGGRKRWWPTKENRLANLLRRRGYEVILTKVDESE